MPFTALHPKLGLLDSTLRDFGRDLEWGQIHKVHPHVALVCLDCS